MSRRSRSTRSIETRLTELEEQSPDLGGWRALLDLPADATRADGYFEFLRGVDDDIHDEAWTAYWEARDGDGE
jgi:hypothetical protein